ncbi:hypothetical protein FRC06_001511 [Ceratobasidium sp. 370]|nr:hypothetical protein FRC06_001511 [Ceratobasidium sp. 370]
MFNPTGTYTSLVSTYRLVYGTSKVVSQLGMQPSQSFQSPAATPCPVQMPLTVLQSYIQAPLATMPALHLPVVLPVAPTGATTISAGSLIHADFSSREGGKNIGVREELRLLPTPGSWVVSIME